MAGFSTNNVTLRQIRAFIAVARAGTFTKAADDINLSQPALTTCIRQLEEQIGVKLFIRTTRLVELTPYGQEFLPAGERLIRDLETAMAALRAMHEGSGGGVALASIASVASALLPDALNAFKAAFPNVGIDVVEDRSEGVRRKVLEGEAEFGLSGATEPVAGVDAQPLFRDRVGIFCLADDPLASSGRPLRWADLKGREIFNMGFDAQIRAVAEVVPEIADLMTATTYKVRNTMMLLSMVREHGTIAVLPKLSIPPYALDDLVFRELNEPTLYRDVFLCRRERTRLSTSAKALLALIRESADRAGAQLSPKGKLELQT